MEQGFVSNPSYRKDGGRAFITIPWEPNAVNRRKESYIFAKFVHVLTTLCMVGLKLFERFYLKVLVR